MAPPAADNPFPAASYMYQGGAVIANNLYYLSMQFVESRGDGFLILGGQNPQRYAQSISSYTFDARDSVVFPVQTDTFSQPIFKLKFPTTLGAAWQSKGSRRTVQFRVSSVAFQLNDSPGTWHSYRDYEDTVVGWGIMRVHLSGNGASGWMPVLQVHETLTVTDSFFINGAEPPAGFLSAFNLTQGQTLRYYFTRFYRAGELVPLADFQHADSSFTDVLSGIVQQSRLVPNGVSGFAIGQGWKIFPNPSRDGNIILSMPGNQRRDWRFRLINMAGQKMAEGATTFSSGTDKARIDLPACLSPGFYSLQLAGPAGTCAFPLMLE